MKFTVRDDYLGENGCLLSFVANKILLFYALYPLNLKCMNILGFKKILSLLLNIFRTNPIGISL